MEVLKQYHQEELELLSQRHQKELKLLHKRYKKDSSQWYTSSSVKYGSQCQQSDLSRLSQQYDMEVSELKKRHEQETKESGLVDTIPQSSGICQVKARLDVRLRSIWPYRYPQPKGGVVTVNRGEQYKLWDDKWLL